MTIESEQSEQDVDLNNEEVLETEEGEKEQPEKEVPKRKFTDEEQLAIHQREAKKLSKKLGKDVDEPKPQPKEKASSDLDLGTIAYLNSMVGLKGKDEVALAREYIANGKTALDLPDNKFFKQDLENLREAKASADAVPKTTKRSSTPQGDDLSVAVAKYRTEGKLPEDRALREKVLDAQLHHEKAGNPFSDNPVVHGGSTLV